MAAKHVEETAKENCTGFGRFKAKLADILTKENILQLATFFHYPPAKIDLLQSKDSRYRLMIRYMEERGQITETDITTLLRALKVLNVHGIQKSVQELFELHTGKRCTGDDQSMQQLKDHTGNLDLGSKGSLTSDSTSLVLESFSSADRQNITLENGKLVPVLSTLEDLQIRTNKGKEFTQEQVIGLLSYVTQCGRLHTLSFMDCLLPLSFPSDSLSSSIEVQWKPSASGFHLDCIKGNWISNSEDATTLETKGQNSLRLLCSSSVFLCETESKPLQMSTILLLQIASSHNIPISCVSLSHCSPRDDESGLNLILESGLSLSILSSLQTLMITDMDRRLTNEELAAILYYSSQCTSLKELRFYSYQVPDTIPVEIIPPSLKSRNVKVWNDSIFNRRLDLQTDRWQVCDKWGKLPGEEMSLNMTSWNFLIQDTTVCTSDSDIAYPKTYLTFTQILIQLVSKF